MTNPNEIIHYVDYFIDKAVDWFDQEYNVVILKSALAYQYLYQKNFNQLISVETVLEENNGEIGLIGPGNSSCTCILEKLFGRISCCHTHSILHDAYGRFYLKYKQDKGYCYAMKNAPEWMKRSPLFGHVTGFLFSIIHRI